MACLPLPLVSIFLLASMTSLAYGQGCRTVDAAMRYDHKTYLFVGPDVITLDGSGMEAEINNKEEDWGGLTRLDAAMTWKDKKSWSSSYYPIFLEGATYSYYSYWRGSTYGPYPVGGEDAPFPPELQLEKGVDAAVTMNEESVFFKCCNYFSYDHDDDSVHHPSQTLQDAGLPCNIHAAMPVNDGELGLLKYDQMWIVNAEEVHGGGILNVTGPVDANELMDLSSVRLCNQYEDAGLSLSDHEDSDDDDDSETTDALSA